VLDCHSFQAREEAFKVLNADITYFLDAPHLGEDENTWNQSEILRPWGEARAALMMDPDASLPVDGGTN
jgi:hypothetical protein